MSMTTEMLGQAKFYRDLNAQAVAQEPPTLVTEGVEVPDGIGQALKVQVAAYSSAASGTRTQHVRVYGWVASAEVDSGDPNTANTALTVGKWFQLEDLGLVTDTDVRLTAGDFGQSYQFEVGHAFSRLATRLAATPGGGTPACTTYIGFSQ